MNTTAKCEIRETVENWALWRDAGFWEKFRTVWHDDGYMTATWFQGSADEFIQVSRKGFENGVNILHFLGGSTIEVEGSRAISQTKMHIMQRADVDGVEVDVVCIGRFYDFFEERNGAWKIVRRQPIYEKDTMAPVNPDVMLNLDASLLGKFPVGYRHLAYLQAKGGFDVAGGLPGLTGLAVENIYAEGDKWLAGSETAGIPL